MSSFSKSKILSKTDVNKQMAIDSKFVQYLPGCSRGGTVPFYVTDENSGKVWEFGYYLRKEGHPKPVLQGGWHDFRREKGLKKDDRITFNVAAGGGSFSILAERKMTIKIMGQDIWERL